MCSRHAEYGAGYPTLNGHPIYDDGTVGEETVEVYTVAIRDPHSDYTTRKRLRVFGPRDLESHMAHLREEWAGYDIGTPRREA